MFGIQWDLVLKHLNVRGGLTNAQITSNSSDWGNYKSASFTIDRGEWTKYGQWGTWNKIYDRTKDDEYYVQNEIKKAETSGVNNSGRVLLTTGAANVNSKMNIYDLAGNLWEWNLNRTWHFCYPCSYRGGGSEEAGDYTKVTYRNAYYATTLSYSISFRLTLY